MLTKNNRYKCDYCNKFIKMEEIKQEEIKQIFTPDSEFTIEGMEYYHKQCFVKLSFLVEGNT